MAKMYDTLINPLGSCILATLTNNMEVSIWTPIKNPLTGEWVKASESELQRVYRLIFMLAARHNGRTKEFVWRKLYDY